MSQFKGFNMKQNDIENNAYYIYPFKYDSKTVGLSRNLFTKAVEAEFSDPDDWEDTIFAGGYLKPLYLNPIYQKKQVIGLKEFPFSLNKDVNYDYGKGLCPNAEELYESKLILSPIIREPLDYKDIDDIITAVKKVINNAQEIKSEFPDIDDSSVDFV